MHNSRAVISNDVYIILWSLTIILFPFYVFKSGMPQIADYLMAILIFVFFATSGFIFPRRTTPIIQTLGWFVSYVILINLAWTLITNELRVLQCILFYIYNFLVVILFVSLYSRFKEKILRATVYSVFISVLIQTFISFFFFNASNLRQDLFFNNPNQLGYFAVLSATIFFAGSRHFTIDRFYQIIFYISIVYLSALSLSKAALLAIAFFGILLTFKRPSIILLTIICILVLQPVIDSENTLAMNLQTRIENIGENDDDSLAGRGYDRIINHPGYLFLGAGEGHYDFNSAISGELHSSWGTILFAYGVPGTIIFTSFIFLIYKFAGFSSMVALFPVFLYGLTHQGLRFTLFWILLSFILCLALHDHHQQCAQPGSGIPVNDFSNRSPPGNYTG